MFDRICKALISISRVLRFLGWGIAILVGRYHVARFETALPGLEGAPQEAALAGETLVYLMIAYLVARAWDRMGALFAEWMLTLIG
jgi:hypothetical protein